MVWNTFSIVWMGAFRLNRPQKRNALTLDMYMEFAELLNMAQAIREIRVVLKASKMPSRCVLFNLITGTCNCFAGARLLLSRCCVEIGRSALQTWPIRVKGARND
jgi:hypothetical protein